MPSLQDALFTELAFVGLHPAGVQYGTFDLEDETGPHTGWFLQSEVTSMFFLDGASTESEAHDAADTHHLEEGYKRATAWKCGQGPAYSGDTSYCYVI